MPNTAVTIYHNPNCSKSRQTLALLEPRVEAKEITLEIVLYLETPPNAEQIQNLANTLKLSVREIIRTSEDAYKEKQLSDTSLSNAKLIQAVVDSPKLLQRPIVVANGQGRIGRPPECVLEILG